MRAVSAQVSAMLAAVFAMLSRGARASGSSCELVYLDIGSNIGDSLHAFAFHRPAKVLTSPEAALALTMSAPWPCMLSIRLTLCMSVSFSLFSSL